MGGLALYHTTLHYISVHAPHRSHLPPLLIPNQTQKLTSTLPHRRKRRQRARQRRRETPPQDPPRQHPGHHQARHPPPRPPRRRQAHLCQSVLTLPYLTSPLPILCCLFVRDDPSLKHVHVCVYVNRSDLRRNPRGPQDVPRGRHPRRRHVHGAREAQDGDESGRRVCAQAAGEDAVWVRGVSAERERQWRGCWWYPHFQLTPYLLTYWRFWGYFYLYLSAKQGRRALTGDKCG